MRTSKPPPNLPPTEELVRALASPRATAGRLQRLATLQAALAKEVLAETELLDSTRADSDLLAEQRSVATDWLPDLPTSTPEHPPRGTGSRERHHIESSDPQASASGPTEPMHARELLTSDELASRLNVRTRQTVHDWRNRGTVIGWQGAKRGYVYPARQLDSRGLPPPDLPQIVALFSDHYVAWTWLTTPQPTLNGAKPLHLLRKGLTDLVLAAARNTIQRAAL